MLCWESTSEAQNEGIQKIVIQANNQWKKFSRSKGIKALMSMMKHYRGVGILGENFYVPRLHCGLAVYGGKYLYKLQNT